MARDFGPFPTKPMYEVVNRRMQRALAEATVSTGFAETGQGAVTAGTGAELVIAAYPDGALVDGLYVENPASETVTVTTNSGSTNPRIDRLVMRLDMAAETIAPFQIVGTPAASPSAPPLVKTATVFDMPLCRYTFPGSASAQNPGSIVDERLFAGGSQPALLSLASGWSHASLYEKLHIGAQGTDVRIRGTVHNDNPVTNPTTTLIVPAGGIPSALRPTTTVQRSVFVTYQLGAPATQPQRVNIYIDGGMQLISNVAGGGGLSWSFDLSYSTLGL